MSDPIQDLQRLVVKLPIADDAGFEPEELIPIFHGWIQTGDKLDEMLFDVADYIHVPKGPGIMLISHEINFSVDTYAGVPGLTAQRKHAVEGELGDRILSLLRSALKAAVLLEQDARTGDLKFAANEFYVSGNDRLRAPNTEEAYRGLAPTLEKLASDLYSVAPAAEWVEDDRRNRLTAKVTSEDALDAATLLARLEQ